MNINKRKQGTQKDEMDISIIATEGCKRLAAPAIHPSDHSSYCMVQRQPSQYSDSLPAGRSGDQTPVGGEIFRTRPDRQRGKPSLLYNG